MASYGYYGTHPLLETSRNYAEPTSAGNIAAALFEAHRSYCKEMGREDPIILFIVQEGERNVYDQKAIEDILLHKWVPQHGAGTAQRPTC